MVQSRNKKLVKPARDVPESLDKRVRGFMMYANLEESLIGYIKQGDQFSVKPVYQEDCYPDAKIADISLINLVKFLSTMYGLTYFDDAKRVIAAFKDDHIRKKVLRFRSDHPLFVDGSQEYQNACLISGMIYMGIPILPYFDGAEVLV